MADSIENVAKADAIIENKIRLAKLENTNLRVQLQKSEARIKDATLRDSAKGIISLLKNNVAVKPRHLLKGHSDKVASVRWGSDSRSILSASQDGFMIIWDAITGFKLDAIPLDSQWVLTCAYSPNRRLVASAGLNNACTVYRLAGTHTRGPQQEGIPLAGGLQQSINSIFKGHTCYISDCDFLDDTRIVTASGDMTCALWDINKGSRTRTFVDHLGDVLSLSIQPHDSGNLIATGASDGYMKVWDVRTPTPVFQSLVGAADVNIVKFLPEGHSLMSGSDDGTARLFDLRSSCETMTFNSPNSQMSIESLDFSPSSRLMMVCYAEEGCMIWDTLKGEVVGQLPGHAKRINNVVTSPDGLSMCTSSWDSTLKVWSAN